MAFLHIDQVLAAKAAVTALMQELEIKKIYTPELRSRYKAVSRQADIPLTEWLSECDSEEEQAEWGKPALREDGDDFDTEYTYVEEVEMDVGESLSEEDVEFPLQVLGHVLEALESCESKLRNSEPS